MEIIEEYKNTESDQNQSVNKITPVAVKEEPTNDSFIDEYFKNMEENGSDSEQFITERDGSFPIFGQSETEELISKEPLFPIDGGKTSLSKCTTNKSKEKRLTNIAEKIYANATGSNASQKFSDSDEIDKMLSTHLESDSTADHNLIIQDPTHYFTTSTKSDEDLTHGVSDEITGKEDSSLLKTESNLEGTSSNPCATQSTVKLPPKIDKSIFDMSWLSSGEQPLNIADLSFEQFQLLYYQHLFKNTKDVPSPPNKSSKRTSEVSRNVLNKVTKPPTEAVKVLNKAARSPTEAVKGSNTTSSTTKSISVPYSGNNPVAVETKNDTNNESTKPDIVQSNLKPPGFGFTHKCSRCDEVFRSRLELTAHDKRAHATDWDSDLQCQTCKKKFSSKYYLNQHELTHKGDLPFPCDLCDKRFLCKGTLETHVILLHTEDRPYKCEECGAAFKLKKILMRHVSTHTKEAPYQCPSCDKRFSRRGSLNRHELIHTGEKPFQCEVCEKRFTQKSTLTLHMMGHTNERPYQCPKCNKSFRKKSHLTRHDSVHTGKKRYYECKVCKKCFAEKYCLVEHERMHKGDGSASQAVADGKVSSDGVMEEESEVSKDNVKGGNDDKSELVSEDE